MYKTRAVIADAGQLFREALARLLTASNFEVCLETDTIRAAAEALPGQGDVHLVIFDFAEGASEAELAIVAKLREEHRDLKLVLVTNAISRELMNRLEHIRLDGYLVKSLSLEALTHSLDLIMLGSHVYPLDLMVESEIAERKTTEQETEFAALSARELEVLRYLTAGHSNKAIANALGIQEATVKVHLKSILRKLKLTNRTQAALWARERGLQAVADAA